MANKFLTALGLLAGLINPVTAATFKVTNGTATYKDGVIEVSSVASRIDFPNTNGERFGIIAQYNGPTETTIPLASGVVQEQFGIKLRAANTCNLIYIMRRFTPVSKVTIMYKQNIGMTTHEECGDKGYAIIKDIPVPSIPVGTLVRLEGKFEGSTLTVKLNDKIIWVGLVDFRQTGISGFRSDNAKVKFSVIK
jgi:hypothetical protein